MAWESPSTDALIGVFLTGVTLIISGFVWIMGLHGTAKGAEQGVKDLKLYVERELARIERVRHEDLTAAVQSRLEVMERLDSLQEGQTRILGHLARMNHEGK